MLDPSKSSIEVGSTKFLEISGPCHVPFGVLGTLSFVLELSLRIPEVKVGLSIDAVCDLVTFGTSLAH